MEAINNHEVSDDKVEFLMQLWKEKLKNIDEKKRRQIAESLVDDIPNFTFDLASNETKYEVLGNKLMEIVNNKKDDEIPSCVDVYYIQENIVRMFGVESREQEAFSMIFEKADENTRDISLMNEFLASQYVMRHINEIDHSLLEKIFTYVSYTNVREFMNGVLKHETFPVKLAENFELKESFIHKCVEEKLLFLLDPLLEKLKLAENEQIKRVLNHTDGNGNNIFHLACQARIKFVLEELWNLMQKVYGEDSKELVNYLLMKNANEANAFQLAFEMPLRYTSCDFANEVKSKETLFRYYRNRGPIELEMYNFESCLNFLYDVGRRNIPDKAKKSMILKTFCKKRSFCENYSYSREFAGFRHDFLQLRYYCITKLSMVKTDNIEKSLHVYNFLNHYVENYMSSLDENELIELYTKLSYDAYMGSFFNVFVKNYFSQALRAIFHAENLKTLFEITKKALGEDAYSKILMERNSNNTLLWAINSSNVEIFELTFDQIKHNPTNVKQIFLKKFDGCTALQLVISNQEVMILQIIFEYLVKNYSENEILEILNKASKHSCKFMDTCISMYNQNVFNLVWSFIDAHLSRENQRLLIGESIISLAVSRWQESAANSVFDLLSYLFVDSEIKQFLSYKNWEAKTAFHIASKNSNLSQLQMLCKFAHSFLSKDDFMNLISPNNSSDMSIINPEASQEDIYNCIPNVSNFSSDRSVFEWAPFTNFSSIPEHAVEFDSNENEKHFIGKSYSSEDPYNFSVIKVSPSMMLEDGNCVDVLVGRGVMWVKKINPDLKELKVEKSGETYSIVKDNNEISLLMSGGSSENYEKLVLNDSNLNRCENQNWLFQRVF